MESDIIRPIETADRHVGRPEQALVSAKTFYRNARTRLYVEREKLRIERDVATTDAERADIQSRLNENYAKDKAIEAAWRQSSLRRTMGDIKPSELADANEFDVDLQARHAATERRDGPAVATRATETDAGTSRVSPSVTQTAKQLHGYAAVFDQWSPDLGGFRERIDKHAFDAILNKADCRCLFNHDSDHIFARTTAYTLELATDSHGLKFVASLLERDSASWALARRIARGDIAQCSFCFRVARDDWTFASRVGELDSRTILEISELLDVGPVVYPAYPQTSVQAVFGDARSADPGDDDTRESALWTNLELAIATKAARTSQRDGAGLRKALDIVTTERRRLSRQLPAAK